jgi:(1->4)-alpha-D-glucan 1-alpha-D-glucosylmutase
MPLSESAHAPSSTYRVQLHKGFTFADLGRLAAYFQELGISDIYLSPIFKSVPGSQHGYDVTDFGEVNPELGGAREFARVAALLRSHGCRIILDFVPNHMGIEGALNRRWRSVLEHGPQSRYASFFDIQWRAEAAEDHPRILVPVLGEQYGKVLEQGEISLVYDKGLLLRHQGTTFPLRPQSYPLILRPLVAECPAADAAALEIIVSEFNEGIEPDPDEKEISNGSLSRRTDRLKDRLDLLLAGSAPLKGLLDARLAALNGQAGNPASFDELHGIIERQHYRLARWQSGAHEINYRRFFAIDTLVGLHMENPDVFRESHAFVARLLLSGEVAGLRIDHIDGLRLPADYLGRLQALPRAEEKKPLFVLVEKILARQEALPLPWPVHGTTGYEFIGDLAALLVDPSQAADLDRIYRRLIAEDTDYGALVTRSKRLIIAEMFANAVSNLGAELMAIVAGDRLWRDLTRHELTTAVSELAAHLPVYRTYRCGLGPLDPAGAAVMREACARAVADNPRAEPQALEFVRDLVTGAYPPQGAPVDYQKRLLGWVLTFQQYTGAIMAKSVEDTAFYTFNRLVGLNEVGCDPGMTGGDPDLFHAANAARKETTPLSLLATSTHDSKFSEDVRARLYTLSEIASEWGHWAESWLDLTEGALAEVDGKPAPDALDRYRFFQVLLGAWPLTEDAVDDAFRERLREHLRKSVDEAKRHTSIMNRNEAYLAACDQFVDRLTDAHSGRDFLAAFRPCAGRVARLGMVNALTQVVLKCTVPGIPDFYQGNETWDFSLVDPDNRRAVDFAARAGELAGAGEPPAALLENWRSGALKLRVTRDLLRLRREIPDLFQRGSYHKVAAIGRFAPHVVAFLRSHGDETLLVAVPRVTSSLGCPPTGQVWDDTRIEGLSGAGKWQDVVTGRPHPGNQTLYLRSLLCELPFAVLRARIPQ